MIDRDTILTGAMNRAGASPKPVDALMRDDARRLDKARCDDERWLREEMPGNMIVTSDTLRDESTAGRGYALEDDAAGRWLRQREASGAETNGEKVRVALSRLGGTKVPAADIVAKVKLRPRAVTRALEHLQRDGVVRREGATKNATYDLVA